MQESPDGSVSLISEGEMLRLDDVLKLRCTEAVADVTPEEIVRLSEQSVEETGMIFTLLYLPGDISFSTRKQPLPETLASKSERGSVLPHVKLIDFSSPAFTLRKYLPPITSYLKREAVGHLEKNSLFT